MPSFTINGSSFTEQALYPGETGRIGQFGFLSTFSEAIVVEGSFTLSVGTPLLINAGTIESNEAAMRVGSSLGQQGSAYIVNTGRFNFGGVGLDARTSFLAMTVDNGFASGDLLFGLSDDMLVIRDESTVDRIDGSFGVDWLNYAGWTGSGFFVPPGAGIFVTLGGTGTGYDGNAVGFENVYGSDRRDTITGDAGDNVLAGRGGNDTISGANGRDTLWGGDGDDTLGGGAGNDLIYGGDGNDVMAGGNGNDIFQVTEAGDIVTELPGEGTDSVFATVSWTLTSLSLESVHAVGLGITLQGGVANDALVADASAGTTLVGADGEDRLWGQSGGDTLEGGAGSDVLRGGDGHDVLSGGADDDQLVGGAGADSFRFDLDMPFGTDELFDFNRAAGDTLLFLGPAEPFAIAVLGGNTQLVMAQGIVNLYGVVDLAAADIVFA